MLNKKGFNTGNEVPIKLLQEMTQQVWPGPLGNND